MNVIRRHSTLFGFTLFVSVLASFVVYMLTTTANIHARTPPSRDLQKLEAKLDQLEAKLDQLDCGGGDGCNGEVFEAKLDVIEVKLDNLQPSVDALEAKLDLFDFPDPG